MSKSSNARRRREQRDERCYKCGSVKVLIEHRVGYPALYSCDCTKIANEKLKGK